MTTDPPHGDDPADWLAALYRTATQQHPDFLPQPDEQPAYATEPAEWLAALVSPATPTAPEQPLSATDEGESL